MILAAASVLLLGLTVHAFALPLTKRLVLLWAWLYTTRLPQEVRDRRRDEIRSDLWDHSEHWRREGYSPELIAMHMLIRWLTGIVADISWRLQGVRQQSRVLSLPEFGGIYERCFVPVFAYVYGRVHEVHLAEDICGSIFSTAFRERIPEGDDPLVQLIKIARRSAEFTPAGTSSKRLAAEVMEVADSGTLPDDLGHGRHERILADLRRLPEFEQELISLKFDAELTNRQISKVLGTSEILVRVRLFRVIRKLRTALGDLVEP